MLRIGVLALQGDFKEHIEMLRKCNADVDSEYGNIASVNSNTSLTLTSSYGGSGCGGAAAYSIWGVRQDSDR